jgi:hypothetical protein
MRITGILSIGLLMTAAAAHARPLEKRSRIELRGGLWNLEGRVTSQAGADKIEMTLESRGPVAGLTYGYWLREHVAATASITFLFAKVSSQIESSRTSTSVVGVFSMLLGVRYYLPQPDMESPWRPYLAAGVGSYIGAEDKSEVGSQIVTETHTETAFGGYLGGGLDLQLSRRFMLGTAAGYHLMTDYSQPLGGRKNYSAPEFSLSISFLFGGG